MYCACLHLFIAHTMLDRATPKMVVFEQFQGVNVMYSGFTKWRSQDGEVNLCIKRLVVNLEFDFLINLPA